ncbi:TraB/GumN family protein, partial [Methanobrevibacter sp.]|uniref:TraB/GumN family protein n=1 Tax=Methanobrevibacter sp. TaxID=66852 RepID=UPI00388E72DD
MNERNGVVEDDTIHITKIIKENKVGVFLVTTLLSYMQNKIGEDVDIKPGAEMLGAIEASEEVGCRIALIDRDINITLQRVLNSMSTWEKLKFVYGIVASLFSSDEEEINIEELKEQSNIDQAMEYFKEISPGAYTALVKERDAYLAKGILGIPEDRVIAVVGAGHKEGIIEYLDHPETLPSYAELNNMNKKGGIPWLKIILALIPISFVVIFFLAWMNGIHIEGDILQFIVISMIMGFIGSILSGSKIQSALIGGLVAPLTIIHPVLAAGWFSGLAEAKFRHVRKQDINNLGKIESFRDLWNNNIIRILLVVVGTNLGVSIATLIILPSKVFIPLFMKIFGG